MTFSRFTASHARPAACAAALLVLSMGGCGLPPNPTRPELLTMAELEGLATTAAAMDPAAPPLTFFHDGGVPGGLRIGDYLTKQDDGYHLTLRDTFTEGYRSAYVTGELWKGFDEVWVQPVYVAITGFVNGEPQLLPDAEGGPWSPIFSVGPKSGFYSPFWRTFYFQVPAGTKPETYKSARDVIDSKLPMFEGPGNTMSLVPGPGAAALVLPATAPGSTRMIGGPTGVESGYLDGQEISYLDFGKDNFSWNDDLVVEETPLFVLLYQADDGTLQPMNVPTVGGTGPLYANRPVNVQGGVPRYGAYWRLYTVVVPRSARIFAPENFLAPGDTFPGEMVADKYGDNVLTAEANDASQYVGRVALNPTARPDGTVGCFDDFNNFEVPGPGGCEWLDSQAAIELAVPASAIERTDITVTCPFVSYRDAAVIP